MLLPLQGVVTSDVLTQGAASLALGCVLLALQAVARCELGLKDAKARMGPSPIGLSPQGLGFIWVYIQAMGLVTPNSGRALYGFTFKLWVSSRQSGKRNHFEESGQCI